MGTLDGKVALVTGGTVGIGATTARALAAAGATVVVAGRRSEAGEKVVAQITESGGEAGYVRADLTEDAQAEHMVAEVVRRYGRLDVAFNNAGGGAQPGKIADQDPAVFAGQLALNLTSAFLSMKYEIPAMLAHGGGSIVNNASTMAVSANDRGMSGYIAAKHGLIGLTRAGALEYGRDNIRVNALITGAVLTDRLRAQLAERPEVASRLNVLGRPASQEEIAAFVVFLAGDEAAFITGSTLEIDGGSTLN